MQRYFYLFLALCGLTACEPDFFYDEGEEIPDPPFTVNLNDSTFTDATGQKRYTGCICEGGTDYQFSTALLPPPAPVPPSTPERHDLSAALPPVGDQGAQPSASSWVVSYYLRSLQTEATLSPAYSYNQLTRGGCSGTGLPETFGLLQDQGAIPLAAFPYDPTDCQTQPDSSQQATAAAYRLRRFHNLDDQNLVREIKNRLLDNTPVALSLVLTDQFSRRDSLGLTAYRPHDTRQKEGICHALLVVGYDEAHNAFKAVNSWGRQFGDNGFVWIDYAAFANAGNDTASFRVINRAMIGVD